MPELQQNAEMILINSFFLFSSLFVAFLRQILIKMILVPSEATRSIITIKKDLSPGNSEEG